MAKMTAGINETAFRSMAKAAVVEYWNGNKNLTKKFGEITHQKVYVVWQAKVLQNNKALLGVNFDGDGMYFEATYNGDKKEMYLDVYKKQTNIVVK